MWKMSACFGMSLKDRSKSAVLIAKRHSSVIRGSPCRSKSREMLKNTINHSLKASMYQIYISAIEHSDYSNIDWKVKFK